MLFSKIKCFKKEAEKKDYQGFKGFTLIELMIVIAIVDILTAIAIPNFIAYRKKAKIDGMLDDGDLSQGKFRQSPNGRYTYIIDE